MALRTRFLIDRDCSGPAPGEINKLIKLFAFISERKFSSQFRAATVELGFKQNAGIRSGEKDD